MIGYLYLLIALFAGATKGFCGKKTSDKLIGTSDAMLVNTVRMVFCVLIGLSVVAVQGEWGQLFVGSDVLFISFISGVTTAIFVVTWLLYVRQGAYAMLDLFLLVSVVIPILLCYFLYGEPIKIAQWIGIGLLILSGFVMSSYNTSIKGKMSIKAKILLLLCTVSCGLSDFSQKLFVRTAPEVEIAVFSLYSYAVSGVLLFVFYVFLYRKEKKREAIQSPTKLISSIFGYVFVMAGCLFVHSYFKTAATKHLDAAEIYPLSQGGSLILTLFMSVFFFKERINIKAVLGIALCFLSLLVINLA